MALSDSQYSAPTLPFPVEASDSSPSENIRDDFMLDFETWTFLNHGAFGAALKVGYDLSAQWRIYAEKQPLRYFDRDLLPHLGHSARCLADFMHAPSRSNVTILPNVTAGLNAALAGHAREYGESSTHCILWDTSYGSVKKMAHHYYKGNVTEIPLQARYLDRLASTNPEQAFQEALDDCLDSNATILHGKRVCLILDQTTSNTALTMPIVRLAAQAKERRSDAVVVVDGAHGLLAQDTNLSKQFDAGVDIYLTNGHKWLSAPRGVAFMAAANDDLVQTVLRRPAVLSHGVDEPDLLSRFVWDGCRDYAAALSVPAVLDHWNRRDPMAVRQECKDKLQNGIEILAEVWHGSSEVSTWPGLVTLADFESSILSPMALVRLPSRFGSDRTSADTKKVQDYLYQQNIEVPIKCINGELYVRVSCHVYNELSDFMHLAADIQSMP